MISFDKAIETVLKAANRTVGKEKISFTDALGRILSSDVQSDMDMPPFNKSAVDGFACRRRDLSLELKVIETIPAGKRPQKRIGSGECARIMTGAPIPEGADAVIMVEDAETTGENRIRYRKPDVKDNICYLGEDIRKGRKVVSAGTRIEPQHIAVLATVGCVEPEVYERVKTGIVSTGNEIIEPHEKPSSPEIRNSNAYQLMAQAKETSADPTYYGIAKDDPASTRSILEKAIRNEDIVLITGGVSMGDYDFVPQVLEELGTKILFDSVAVQPGRPTVFGTVDGKFVFGLPGNPVSSFVQFELLVKPLINRLSGSDFSPPVVKLPLALDYTRRKSTRLSVLPVTLDTEGRVVPLEYHGSAHINALTAAFGFMFVPTGQTRIEKGSIIDVRQI